MFTVKGTNWPSVQLLRAVLSGALSIKNVRLLVHGFPWKAVDLGTLTLPKQVVISNGPLIPYSAIVLTESTPQSVTKLAKRFLRGDSLLSENLSLLTHGDGLVIVEGDVMFTTWKNHHVDRGLRLS